MECERSLGLDLPSPNDHVDATYEDGHVSQSDSVAFLNGDGTAEQSSSDTSPLGDSGYGTAMSEYCERAQSTGTQEAVADGSLVADTSLSTREAVTHDTAHNTSERKMYLSRQGVNNCI
jgi:hypothetical protein